MKKLLLFVIYPVAQIFISLLIGYFALNLVVPSGVVHGGATFSGVDIAGMDTAEASAIIKHIGDKNVEKGIAAFTYNDMQFYFHFNEIGLSADYSRIESSLSIKDTPFYLQNLFTAFIRNYGAAPKPEYTADSDAFREKLNYIKTFIDKAPVDADIEYTKDGEIVLSPSEKGVYFDIDNQFDIIYSEFLFDPFKIIALDSNAAISDAMLVIEEPLVTDAYLAGIDTVLSQIQTPVPADYDMPLVALAAEAINKVWAPKKGKAYSPFSFLRYIDEAGLPIDKASREYNLVASALLHALLIGGVDYAKIEAVKSFDIYAYIGLPGFGVELLSYGGGENTDDNLSANSVAPDFLFTNTLDGNIVIFASVADGELNIAVAGKKDLSGNGAAPYNINSEILDGKVSLFRNGKKVADYSQ